MFYSGIEVSPSNILLDFVNFGAYSEWWKIKCFSSVIVIFVLRSDRTSLYFRLRKSTSKIPIPLFQRGLCDCSIKCSPPWHSPLPLLVGSLAPTSFLQVLEYITMVWNMKCNQNQSLVNTRLRGQKLLTLSATFLRIKCTVKYETC